MLVKMLDAGMNVARCNFSHGDHETHGKSLDNLRAALKQRPDATCGVMLDTKGPEIRTGMLKNKEGLVLKSGQSLKITTDYDHLGDEEMLACSYKDLMITVKIGSTIFIADGSLTCTVLEIKDDHIVVRCENGVKLGERKNMNLPGAIVTLPTLTEKDEDDLVDFGLEQNIDFIAASFVRKASDVEYIRDVLGPKGSNIKIISKIENQEGLNNYDEILAISDGIMVARGDLGMEIPPEKVFIAQKWMIEKANIAAKPVVTATQMLESMINAPRPTRAEASDVANAVLDGSDCVMLSGESAGGSYPLQAVNIMAKCCIEAESCIQYRRLYNDTKMMTPAPIQTAEAVASACCSAALDLPIGLIIVLTDSGKLARLVSKYRP
jgi:pyruvate kinase